MKKENKENINQQNTQFPRQQSPPNQHETKRKSYFDQ